jgi:hypothetical protein
MLNEWWMIDWLTVHMFWLRESIWLTEFTNTIKSWMKRCSNCQRAPPFLAASSLSLFTFQSKGVVRVSLKNASRKMTDQFAVNTPNLLWCFDESGSPKDDELVVELVIPLRLVPQGRSTNHEWVFYEDMFSFCCNCIEMFVSWKLASPFPMTMHR